MIKSDEEKISDIVLILKQLDKESLILIDAGVKMLASRQRLVEMEDKNESKN